MCIAYSVLSCKLATSFSTFQSSFFQVKTVIHHDVHLMFQNIDYQIQKISFTTFFFIVFYEIFIKLKSYLLEAFKALPNHINYLHPNIEGNFPI